MKKNNENGIVNIDYITAVIIFMIGSVTVLGLYVSNYKSMAKIKIDETIIGYITEICENIDLVNYENIDTQEEVNQIIDSIDIPEQYIVECASVEKYSNNELQDTLDLVMRINLRVRYSFDNLSRDYVISKIKVKE
ncbi:MAG: hypothetical protein IKG14_03855 [Clostridia bacterium]|nr:hypothetical protein [Clostridia bacterium]